MYIIDKNKDYYDYYSHIYGEDKNIVFDRRGSVICSDENLCWTRRQTKERHILLEVGNVQYIIEITNIKYHKPHSNVIYSAPLSDFISCEMILVKTIAEHKNIYGLPISIKGIRINQPYWFKRHKKHELDYGSYYEDTYEPLEIKLPILANTKITSLIPAEDIWKELSTFVSSQKTEKDVDIQTTDVEKAINHGFDKKSSFRNPIRL